MPENVFTCVERPRCGVVVRRLMVPWLMLLMVFHGAIVEGARRFSDGVINSDEERQRQE
jgi:hypothetical protein